MQKIEVMDYANDYNFAHMWSKLNNVIQAINNLRCQEKEEPIYEVLNPYDCLLISKNEDGILVACSDEKGKVHLERVPYPSEDSEYRGFGMGLEIKVTKCGELDGCELNDRICIGFSPYELTNLIYLFSTRVREAEDHSDQDNERKLHKAFSIAREMWEKARKEKDK